MNKKAIFVLTAALGLTISAFASNWDDWTVTADPTVYERTSTGDGHDGHSMYEIQFQNLGAEDRTVQLYLDSQLINGHLHLSRNGGAQNVSLYLTNDVEREWRWVVVQGWR